MQTELDLNFVLIPEGEFTMGSSPSTDRQAQPDEKPAHKLIISNYYIMRYPVTNAQYQQFLDASGHRSPLFWSNGHHPEGKADHPVVGVSFHDAVAFCKWASEMTGKSLRLPTEPEWEKAARGEDGRLYPWGNQWEKGCCNSSEAKLGDTSEVRAFSPQGDSPYSVAEMGGNVQEWCSSLFGKYPYDPADGREVLVYAKDIDDLLPRLHETGCTSLPQSMEAGLDKSLIRGGSWRETKYESRCAYRSWAAPMHRSDDTGFRCVYEP
jgi:iron(II)-dependent oxidoreductase